MLTEAIKKAYANAGKDYSANLVALVNAIVVGCGGTAVLYMLLTIPWTINNVICMLLMGVAVWVSSMIGYDKVIQLIKQLAASETPKEKEGEE